MAETGWERLARWARCSPRAVRRAAAVGLLIGLAIIWVGIPLAVWAWEVLG